LIDHKVTQIVKKAQRKEIGGMPMVTAIKNEKNEIYRVITMEGLGAYISLANNLAAIGFVDIHRISVTPGEYDSIFIVH
jgi:hypothetical protein